MSPTADDQMQPRSEQSELEGWQRLIGTWATKATHPLLPGAEIRGESTFDWLEGRQFVIWRSHYDHPEIPDAIAIIGVTDGQLSTHYFDYRGVHRVYAVSLDDDAWQFWRDDPASPSASPEASARTATRSPGRASFRATERAGRTIWRSATGRRYDRRPPERSRQ